MDILKRLVVTALFAMGIGIAQADSLKSPDEQFRSAYITETTERDLDRAALQYKGVVGNPDAPPSLRSEASYRLGLCFERLGRSQEALDAYRAAVFFDTDQSRPHIESAKSGVARLEAALRPPTVPEIKRTLRPGQKFYSPIHQLMIAGASLAQTTMGGDGVGLELLAYEYIHPSGFALKLSPLNGSFWTESDGDDGADWAPAWLRYYFLPETHRSIPYIGLGFVESHRERVHTYSIPEQGIDGTFQRVYTEYERTSRSGLGLELGFTVGDLGRRSNRISLRALPIGTSLRDTTFQLAYDFSLGLRSN